jgi:cystathionine gamma-lyase
MSDSHSNQPRRAPKLGKKTGLGTRAVHAGQEPDPATGAVMTPIYQVSTYAQPTPGQYKGYDYSRTDNPTRTAYQDCVAELEGAEHGLAFSSGMSAMDAVIRTLRPGDHVVCCDDVYGGTFRLFDKVFRKHGFEFTFVDLSDASKTEAAFKGNTKLLWIETPTNPMLKVLDVAALSQLAHGRGARVVVDNTFMSPFFQQPLELGADLVVHSVTKYMNGHSDVVGGVLCLNDTAWYQELKFLQNAAGAVPAPWDCFLVLRGLKTLHVRMERHAQNAMEIARYLEGHPRIQRVIYPGLESHPQHALARKQMKGFGGMITFLVKGGLAEARQVLERVELFTLAESLGGVESLIEHPAIMTHASVPPENRKILGIHDNLIRISCGIEDVADLRADLAQALG